MWLFLTSETKISVQHFWVGPSSLKSTCRDPRTDTISSTSQTTSCFFLILLLLLNSRLVKALLNKSFQNPSEARKVEEWADSLRGDQIARELVILYWLQGPASHAKISRVFCHFHISSPSMEMYSLIPKLGFPSVYSNTRDYSKQHLTWIKMIKNALFTVAKFTVTAERLTQSAGHCCYKPYTLTRPRGSTGWLIFLTTHNPYTDNSETYFPATQTVNSL